MESSLRIHRYEARGGNIVASQVSTSNLGLIADWTGGTAHPHTREHERSVSVPFKAGEAFPTDWVIRYPDGRFLVLPDDKFHDRYQRS
jgi:hypothetical protein